MLAVEWQNLGYAGTFVFGLLVGIVFTIRLSKVIADLFRELARRLRSDEDDL